jgi:hypothetical protein
MSKYPLLVVVPIHLHQFLQVVLVHGQQSALYIFHDVLPPYKQPPYKQTKKIPKKDPLITAGQNIMMLP